VPPLVVLAEDNDELRSLLAAALEMIGYRVVQVETGARLLDAMRELQNLGETVRLVISDVRMPTLGGLDAARSIRETGAATPVILMTAYGDAWTRAQAAELGAVLLDKPLSIGTLRRAVQTAVG
jgi:two-component system cell cycle response regulator CpdR